MASRRRRFRLIEGGKDGTTVAGVQIVITPRRQSPFPVEAVTLEEDTYLVLSAKTRLPERSEHPIRVMTALWEAEPEAPGSVVVRPGLRTELLAVVHDLNEEPSWREEWIRTALRRVLEEADRRTIAALGMEPLGCVHGRLERERFEELLEVALQEESPEVLERIWLMEGEELERGSSKPGSGPDLGR